MSIAKCKVNEQKVILQTRLQNQFVLDLKSLRTDEFSDLNMYIKDEDLFLRHRCIVHAICPTLLTDVDSGTGDVELLKFPHTVTKGQKELMESIYSSEPRNVSDDVDVVEIDFSTILESGQYSDVTLKVDGAVFECHKCILSSRCEYFAMMLGGNWRENDLNVIELKDISCDIFKLVLQVIYKGWMDLGDARVDECCELFWVSDIYNIPSIKQQVCHHVRAYLSNVYANSRARLTRMHAMFALHTWHRMGESPPKTPYEIKRYQTAYKELIHNVFQ